MNLIEIANKTAGYKRINEDTDYSTWEFYPEQLQAFADAITKEKDAEIEQLNAKVAMMSNAVSRAYTHSNLEHLKPLFLVTTEQDVTRWVNGVKADALEDVLKLIGRNWILEDKVKQLRGEQI